ncbi:hypothetical protein GCM10007392_19590 [Saccharospirillum salsuginis]|uniref:Uncharacterized protein n=2 Tax=Saccharospirillum salsuginis TaxID=418750 RepID=A0A918K945_9GAMM|nr:hypothetical protein GCM10007392_19590 [Saccharospirillum salsuginis]
MKLAAGQQMTMPGAGLVRKIKVRKADGPVLFRTGAETAPADLGETITFEQVAETVRVENTHTNSNSLELIVIASGEGDVQAAASSVAVSNLDSLQQALSPSDTFSMPGDVTVGAAATQIVPANVDRREVMISLPSSAADSIRIGGAGVTTGSGLELEPGGTVTLNAESAVYGIRVGSVDEAVTVLELRRP